jgi:hypothetical protein
MLTRKVQQSQASHPQSIGIIPRPVLILVDSSVWIDLLNNVVTEPVRRLRELIPTTPLLVGDLILLASRSQNGHRARDGAQSQLRLCLDGKRLCNGVQQYR